MLPGCGKVAQHYDAPRPLVCPPCLDSGEDSEFLPRISIVVPSLNQGRFIESTIRSIVDQSYQNLDLIVVDGSSSDGTLDVLKKYESCFSWWISEPDKGQADAINKGFSKATGDVMAWLNSDDCLHPGVLQLVGRYFAEHPEVDVVYGHRLLIDELGRDVGKWILPFHDEKVLEYIDFVPQETLFWRRGIWERAGSALDDSYQFALDWEFLLRLKQHRARFRLLPYFMGHFRIHPEQKTQSLIDKVGRSEMIRIRNLSEQRCKIERKFGLAPRWHRIRAGKFLLAARVKELLFGCGLIKIS